MNDVSIKDIKQQFEMSHEALIKSLIGISASEAFEGSEWSVSDVLMHLDLSKFIDALQDIHEGKVNQFPSYGTLESAIEKYVEVINENYLRLMVILEDLDENLLDNQVTEYNPENDYPALSLRDLLDRMSRHELTHAKQIDEIISKLRTKP
tara:strand:+ start:21315 stop:21767 length:453 start_codon:yes stop_codon:yes gene_type:complete